MVALLIGGGIVLGVVVLAVGLMTAFRDGQSGADRERIFAVGDCVVWNATGTVFDRVPCSSPRAVSKVYAVVELTELARCVEVDGVERTVTLTSPDRVALCVGPKDEHPDTSTPTITSARSCPFNSASRSADTSSVGPNVAWLTANSENASLKLMSNKAAVLSIRTPCRLPIGPAVPTPPASQPRPPVAGGG
ncbi:hypothetical protein GTC6_14271 [Gordonia terrae C-6]|uniref:Uncharacterized protein n=1 Tax=Gordonia terrae C-6 TaxID=1316928 RepID=R7Y824_9ACTN|nr:hypothetical protein [Gordonia terrae]EON32155.1 hypothetical protein GTC6_14271 [Gordonia terrae C-6]